MSWTRGLSKWGFDEPRMAFAGRTALAACAAVVIAWLLGLEHPQWSGMTVWAGSQPWRGQLAEKSVFRLLGTLVGGVFGMLLLWLTDGNLVWLTFGLAVWIGLCTWAGNRIRGFISYGAMLSGYTAVMVTLLKSTHFSSIFAIGIDRIFTVSLGVLIALLVGWCFAPVANAVNIPKRFKGLVRETEQVLRAEQAAGQSMPELEEKKRQILRQLALMEESLETQVAGSWSLRQRVRRWRGQIVALVQALLSSDASRITSQFLPREVSAYYDTREACRSALRSFLMMALAGAAWLLSGIEMGAFMLVGTAIMVSVFSTVAQPLPLLKQVVIGQALGVGAAWVCRWLVWPYMGSEAAQILSLMPFILMGGLFFGHRVGAGPRGFDFNMVLLLLVQPGWPLVGDWTHAWQAGIAVVLGPVLAMVAFWLIFPANSASQIATLRTKVRRTLLKQAAEPLNEAHKAEWYAQLSLGVLKLARYQTAETATPSGHALVWGYNVKALGLLQQHLFELQRVADATDEQRKAVIHTRNLLLLGKLTAANAQKELQQLTLCWQGSTALDTAKIRAAAQACSEL
ncbi:FUSC family protein [Paenalcaligenes sp. Me131]|uniref:FUSC family protein n=1 Tax=Paenalcaligenes sp. Me131 TaxID=3392636 RepID=UPI003D2B061A